MPRPRRLPLVLFFIAAVASRVGGAQTRTAPTDQQLRTAVVRTLQEHRLMRGKDPQVEVADGRVTLSGQVQSLWEKEEAIRLARAIDGVTTLVSDLVIARAESDAKISEALGDRIFHYNRYSVFDDINARVQNGVITLDGFVTAQEKGDDIRDLAARIQGVQAITNKLEVYPASQSDDRLRNQIAVRIFGDPDLQRYAQAVNPSIHIIVSRGRVTLKGFVYSALDKQRIDSLVGDIFGITKLENQLKATR